MRHRYLYIVFLLLVSPMVVTAQTAVGRDFWLTCFGSIYSDTLQNYKPTLHVVAHENVVVLISNPSTGWDTTVNVMAGDKGSVALPMEEVLCSVSRQVGTHALHVVSSGDIGLWFAQRKTGSNDMSMILPTAGLGRRYVVQDYAGFRNIAAFAVAAVEDHTTVTVTLPGGVSLPGAGGVLTVDLMQGQTYMLDNEAGTSFSGTLVEADKPIFLMHGNLLATVPEDGMPFDLIFEQALPVDTWGQHFALVPTVREADGDRVRVTSSANGCVLRLDGEVVTQIDDGETYELFLPHDTARRLDASRPVQAQIYLSSNDPGGEPGDPSVVLAVPLEQGVNEVLFCEPPAALNQWNVAYVNIAVRTADVPYILFDNSPIDTHFHPIDSLYSYARLPIDAAVHRIVDPVGTLVAHFYWLGWRRSEATVCGMALHVLDRQRLLTDGEERADYVVCQGTTVHFRVEGAMQAHWSVGGEGLPTTSTDLHYTFDSAGRFEVVAVLQSDFDSSLHDSLRVVVTVYPTAAMALEDSVCFNAVYEWNGRTLGGGTYVDTLATVHGCDSVVTLVLNEIEHPDVWLDVDIDCKHFSYQLALHGAPGGLRWRSEPPDDALAGHETDSIVFPDPVSTTLYTVDIDYRCPFSESARLQSITLPQAQVHVSPEFLTLESTELTVCDITERAESRTWWVDGVPAGNGESCLHLTGIDTQRDSVWVTLMVFNGICYDTLTIAVPILHIALWAPNVFTPSQESNNRFELSSVGIAEGVLEIYDRQGNLLYHTDDYRQGWDGKCGGRPMPQAAYVWLLRYNTTYFPNRWQTRVGTVTLVR